MCPKKGPEPETEFHALKGRLGEFGAHIHGFVARA